MIAKITVNDFITRFEKYAPPQFAHEGDPIGLHFGTRHQEISRMMVTLDIRPEVVDEAIDKGIDFIFAHHPPIFNAPKTLTTDDPQQQMYAQLIKHNIAVYAAHTNLDAAPNGMNDWLAERYGIQETTPLEVHYHIPYYRVNVYLPTTSIDALHKVITAAGFGQTEKYEGVHARQKITGHFIPKAEANPSIGEVDKPEVVNETIYSLLCDEFELSECLDLIKANHPYEEPVIDVMKLESLGTPVGIGRIGQLKQPMTFDAYSQFVKEQTGVSGVRLVVADKDKPVQRVAVLGGDGGKFFPTACKKGADVYITGDIYYHVGHDMIAAGLNAIDPGHHFESICKEKLCALFTEWQEEMQWEVTIVASELNTDPFTFK